MLLEELCLCRGVPWWRSCVCVSRGDWGEIMKIWDVKLKLGKE